MSNVLYEEILKMKNNPVVRLIVRKYEITNDAMKSLKARTFPTNAAFVRTSNTVRGHVPVKNHAKSQLPTLFYLRLAKLTCY